MNSLLTIVAAAIVATSCVASAGEVVRLSPAQAARLAAKAANDRCEELFGERPFVAVSIPAIVFAEGFVWEASALASPQGYGARVEMGADGSNIEVKVSYANDLLWRKADMLSDSAEERLRKLGYQ